MPGKEIVVELMIIDPSIYLLLCITSDDIYEYIATGGPAPIPRFGMGFTSTPNGTLYVFGGSSTVGD
jgi:hypothetical protein